MAKIGFVVAMAMVLFSGPAAMAQKAVAISAVPGSESTIEDISSEGAVSNGVRVVVKAARTEIDGNDLAVDELLKIASFEEESLRLAAVEVMGEIGTPRAKAVLGIVLYGNSMGTVRAAAADQLGAFGDGETLFALALALEKERDSEVRDVIASNLERGLRMDGAGVPVAAVETAPSM